MGIMRGFFCIFPQKHLTCFKNPSELIKVTSGPNSCDRSLLKIKSEIDDSFLKGFNPRLELGMDASPSNAFKKH